MKKIEPNTGDIIDLMSKLISFKSFLNMEFITKETHLLEDFKNELYKCNYDLNIYVENEMEIKKMEELIKKHFAHVENVIFFGQFFIPSLKKNVWKKSNYFCIGKLKSGLPDFFYNGKVHTHKYKTTN